MGDSSATVRIPRIWETRSNIIWTRVISFILLHITTLYSLYHILNAKWATVLFAVVYGYMGTLGVTAGAHRLWSHKAYKARWPLRLMLMILHCISGQTTVQNWVREHRVHHKYSETDADPHNAKRGFFFAHIGWLMLMKLPEITAKGKDIDISDALADPILKFQKQYYLRLFFLTSLIIPTYIATLWGESLKVAILACITRYVITLNATFFINSAAHIWGNKPYDKAISPTQNKFVSFVTWGEGFHNYHHTFPWDYRAGEWGSSLNVSALFIYLMSKIGWAYDLKTVPDDVIEARMFRTGDGSY